MLRSRVVPFLLAQGEGLYKTRKFKKPIYVGDPVNAIRIFNEKEVDELALLDITATPERRGPRFELIEEVASECFMPLAYGGGIRHLDDAKRLFAIGVEKLVVRSAAAQDYRIISEIAELAGSQAVALSVDLSRARLTGERRIHAPGTRLDGAKDWSRHVQDGVAAGAGEVVLNSVDRDGEMQGMDLEAIRQAAASIGVPLLAVGGVGSLDHVREGIAAGADAIGAGSFFVFQGPRRAVLITYPSPEELLSVQ